MENRKQKTYDKLQRKFIEMPEDMAAFLQDMEAVFRKHGLCLAHEDTQGGFEVHLLNEENLNWCLGASKRYTREADPETGLLLAPKHVGKDCPAQGKSCLKCVFQEYCYNPHRNQEQKRLLEVLMAANGYDLSDTDARIKVAGSLFIHRHKAALIELAKGPE